MPHLEKCCVCQKRCCIAPLTPMQEQLLSGVRAAQHRAKVDDRGHRPAQYCTESNKFHGRPKRPSNYRSMLKVTEIMCAAGHAHYKTYHPEKKHAHHRVVSGRCTGKRPGAQGKLQTAKVPDHAQTSLLTNTGCSIWHLAAAQNLSGPIPGGSARDAVSMDTTEPDVQSFLDKLLPRSTRSATPSAGATACHPGTFAFEDGSAYIKCNATWSQRRPDELQGSGSASGSSGWDPYETFASRVGRRVASGRGRPQQPTRPARPRARALARPRAHAPMRPRARAPRIYM